MAQSLPATHIEAQIGNVTGGSQVAVGNYIVQIGRVEGGVVNILNEAPPPPRLRTQPVQLRPKPFPGLLDRSIETTTIVEALKTQQSIECTGPPGAGRTSLVRHLAHQTQLDTTFPAGVVYFQTNNQSAADLLKSLFDAFYQCDFPIKPNDTEIRHYLQSLKALVFLDDVDVDAQQITSLMNFAPNCTFIAITNARSLMGETLEVALKGLPTADAVQLFQRELQRNFEPGEENGARLICESVDCIPLLVLRAAHEARTQKRSLLAVVPEAKPGTEQVAAAAISSSTEDEKNVLAALSVFKGVAVAAEHVAAVAGVTNAKPVLDSLEQRGLVESHDQSYAIAGDIKTEQLGNQRHWFARALAHFIDWSEERRKQYATVAGAGAAILLLMKQAAGAQLWSEVRRLGHASEEALTVTGKWDQWANALKSIDKAAAMQGDIAERAWVQHQLGTRALLLGDRAAAEAALRDALGIRERLNDITGAAVTRHNLNILLAPPPPNPDDNSNSPKKGGGNVGPRPTPMWLKVGVLSLVGLAVLTILTAVVIWFVVNPKPPTKPARIASFTVEPLAVFTNEQAQLCYEVENAESVRIEPGVGERKPATKECVSVTPAATVTYTLTAFAADGKSTTQQVTLNVVEPTPPAASIVRFVVERQDGSGAATDAPLRLCYEVRNAAHAEIDNNGGEVVLDQPHCQPINPQQTTTYTLTATGVDGRPVTRQAIADATKPPAPRAEIVSFKAVPDKVVDDGASQLCFLLEGASTAQIDPGASAVNVSAGEQCLKVIPLKTTTYTLKAFNAEGIEVSAEATITAIRSPKIVEFSATPAKVTRGEPINLCYQVENATGVNIDPRVTKPRALPVDRTCLGHRPLTTTTYTLTASNEDGLTAQRQFTVNVEEPKPKHARILFFEVSPPRVRPNDSVRLCYGVADAKAVMISPLNKELPISEKQCFNDSPSQSTTYTLSATGEDNQAETSEGKVIVEAPPPIITRLEIRGRQICYEVTNTQSARIDPGVGQLANLTKACVKLPSPNAETYTLTATGADSSTVRRSVTYTPPEPPRDKPIAIVSFSGPRRAVKPQSPAKLCYSILGEGSAEIQPGPGSVPVSVFNCVSVNPDRETRYTLIVTGPQGQRDSRTVTVLVEAPPVIIQ